MSDTLNNYTVIREYKNEYSVNELLKHIIRIHLDTVYHDITKLQECSNHEVQKYENK